MRVKKTPESLGGGVTKEIFLLHWRDNGWGAWLLSLLALFRLGLALPTLLPLLTPTLPPRTCTLLTLDASLGAVINSPLINTCTDSALWVKLAHTLSDRDTSLSIISQTENVPTLLNSRCDDSSDGRKERENWINYRRKMVWDASDANNTPNKLNVHLLEDKRWKLTIYLKMFWQTLI